MKICKVVGTPTSTIQAKGLEGSKYLLVLPLNPMNMRPDGTSMVCEDRIGASLGNVVLVSQSVGKSPMIDATIIGILDTLDIHGEMIYEN